MRGRFRHIYFAGPRVRPNYSVGEFLFYLLGIPLLLAAALGVIIGVASLIAMFMK